MVAARVCAGVWVCCGAQGVASGRAQSAAQNAPPGGVQSGAAGNTAPVMRVTTRLVQVSAVVEDKKGKPVSGLKPEDFQLLDNGKPQSISFFATEADLQREWEAAPATGGSAKAKLPGNVFENRAGAEPSPGSATVILFDALNTPIKDQIYAKAEILAFLRQLNPQDHVAVYLLTRRLTVINEFTQDAEALLQAVERLRTALSLLETNANQGYVSAADMGIPDPKGARRLANMMNDMTSSLSDLANLERMQITAQALEAVANHVAGIPGRKNLIWVSGSFPVSIALSSSDNSPVDTQAQNFAGRMAQVARVMSQANVAICPVDARGLILPGDFDASVAHPAGPDASAFTNLTGTDEQATMRLLAERTGGRAFINNNDIQGAIRTTLAETRHTYELGFYPDHGNWDGKFHELKLRVKKSGVSLHYRKGYFAVADAPNGANAARVSLQTAMWSPMDASGIGLQAEVQTIDLAKRKLDLRVFVETKPLRLAEADGRYAGSLDAVYLQLGAGDAVVAAEPLTYKIDLSQKDYEAALARGYEMKVPLAIRPETRTLRVIVRDAGSGEVGSVTIPVEKFIPPVATAQGAAVTPRRGAEKIHP